jgi:hypothetical protein
VVEDKKLWGGGEVNQECRGVIKGADIILLSQMMIRAELAVGTGPMRVLWLD